MSPLRLRLALSEIQEGRCFYTGAPLGKQVHIDHFLPWARYANDAIENLVVTRPSVNGAKSAFLAAPRHLHRWFERNRAHGLDLASIATANRWSTLPDETGNVARAIYLGLPEGVLLWSEGKDLVPAERSAVLAAIP